VFSSPPGIEAPRGVCRFIIDVAGGGPMRFASVGLLPSTAQATPHCDVEGLGGRAVTTAQCDLVLPGGAIELEVDRDSRKCKVGVYTPEAVAAGYPQPLRQLFERELNFKGTAFAADGILYPAVSLYEDGVSVRVEGNPAETQIPLALGIMPAL
jgi:hypothetical protein